MKQIIIRLTILFITTLLLFASAGPMAVTAAAPSPSTPMISAEQAISAALREVGENDFPVSHMGSAAQIFNEEPAVAYNSVADEYLVAWMAEERDQQLIFARRVNGTTGQPIGRDFQISPAHFLAELPDVAYNPVENEYLVVWSGEYPGGLDDVEILGRRVSPTGQLLGSPFRISIMGGRLHHAFEPAVAYAEPNLFGAGNRYLVVWSGEDSSGNLVDGEIEVYGQYVNANGALLSGRLRISQMGTDGDVATRGQSPDVAYDGNSFLVVWDGSEQEELFEIYGKLIPLAPGITGGQVRLSKMGADDADPDFDAFNPQVVGNPAEDEFYVIWTGDDDRDGLVNGEFEIFGRRIGRAALNPAPLSDQIRLSHSGPDGDPGFSALDPAVAYNSTGNDYLVFWKDLEVFAQRVDAAGNETGTNDFRLTDFAVGEAVPGAAKRTAAVFNPAAGEFLLVIEARDNHPLAFGSPNSIFAQRVHAPTGAEVGENDFIVSDHANRLDEFWAEVPAVAYDSQDNEFLVVWEGNTNDEPPLDRDENEIFGQRIDGNSGAKIGPRLRVSSMGPDGDALLDAADPAVAYDLVHDQFLVVWEGNDGDPDKSEIFGQFLSPPAAVEPDRSFRISLTSGPGATIDHDAFDPDVVFNPVALEFLVVWEADEGTDGEFEIYGQRVDPAADLQELDPLRISFIGPEGDPTFDALNPAVAFNASQNEYLVVWEGANAAPGELEIFGQRLSAGTPQRVDTPLRISQFGTDGNTSFAAEDPAVAYNSTDNEYLVVWEGEETLANAILEDIYGQRLDAVGRPVGENDFAISNVGQPSAFRVGPENASVVYDASQNRYVVAWQGPPPGPTAEGAVEIFARQVDGNGELPGGPAVISQLSNMGPNNEVLLYARYPALALNSNSDLFLGVWEGADDNPIVTPDDQEIYGQLFAAESVNRPPTAAPDHFVTVQGTPLVVTAPGVLGNDEDLDGDSLTANVVGDPAHGILLVNPNGSFTYTPNAEFTGSDTFSYRADDGNLQSDPTTVTIRVNPGNALPQQLFLPMVTQ